MEATFVSRCPHCFRKFASELKPKVCKHCGIPMIEPEQSRIHNRPKYNGELDTLVGIKEPYFD